MSIATPIMVPITTSIIVLKVYIYNNQDKNNSPNKSNKIAHQKENSLHETHLKRKEKKKRNYYTALSVC